MILRSFAAILTAAVPFVACNDSFETEVLQPQCRLGNLYGIVQNGYFIDIGIPEDYERAKEELPVIFANQEKKQ